MNLHDWIDEVCDTLDIELEVDEALILDLAKDAADAVVRPAAPITTFLLGYAAAGVDGNPEQVEKLAALVSELAGRWDRPADVAGADVVPAAPVDDLSFADLDEDEDSERTRTRTPTRTTEPSS